MLATDGLTKEHLFLTVSPAEQLYLFNQRSKIHFQGRNHETDKHLKNTPSVKKLSPKIFRSFVLRYNYC